MSMTLFHFAESFVSERLSADKFADAYIEFWRIERDTDVVYLDESNLQGCLSSIFCATDMYNPDLDRREYELDEDQLRIEILKLFYQYGLYKL